MLTLYSLRNANGGVALMKVMKKAGVFWSDVEPVFIESMVFDDTTL